MAFSACNKSKAADEATEAVESDKVEKFSLSSLVEAFLELVVEAIEALDRLELKKGNLLKGIDKLFENGLKLQSFFYIFSIFSELKLKRLTLFVKSVIFSFKFFLVRSRSSDYRWKE